jgi:hypothetical protein
VTILSDAQAGRSGVEYSDRPETMLASGEPICWSFDTGEHVVGATMPFSKYDIDPKQIGAMRAAFHRVCDALLLKCDLDDPITEVIANKIVALSKAGEHDAQRMAEIVLNDLADDDLADDGLAAAS